MGALTQPLRDEHKHLIPHIDALGAAGDAVGRVDAQELLSMVDASHEFLAEHLIPHAMTEERALYPVVGRVMGAPAATATMSRDHVEVARLTERLRELRNALEEANGVEDELADGLRSVLYGLATLVRVHFAKEEEVYLPLLDDRLSEAEATELFADMGAAG